MCSARLLPSHCSVYNFGRVEHALDTAGTSVAPPERTNRSGTASVLPPAPTISSSGVHVSHEPACKVVDEEMSDEDEDGDEAEKKGKGTDGDELGED